MLPIISVIIPTYNRASFLKESIESALGQTFRDIEVLVVDDGSTDDTRHLINNFSDQRLCYMQLPHSGLPSVIRNAGINNSRGEFIAFLDSDDLWLPAKLERQMDATRRNPKSGLYYSLAENFDASGLKGLSISYSGKREGHIFESLTLINFIPILTVLTPRNVLENIGLFDERPDFRASEDYDLILRIAARYPIYFTPEILARHRIHASNIWKNDQSMIDRMEKVLYKNFQGVDNQSAMIHRALANLDLARFKLSLKQVSSRKVMLNNLKNALVKDSFLLSAYAYFIAIVCGGAPILRTLYKLKNNFSLGNMFSK